VQVKLEPLLPDVGALRFATYALAAFAGGAALHSLVERPFLHWRDHRAAAGLRSPGRALRPSP
jgi:hypothetical protein